MRVLVGGVGYRNLSDLSAGPLFVDRASEAGGLGERADLEDLSYGPIDVLFALQRRAPYGKLVLVAAAARGDPPGTVRRERWLSRPIDPAALQGCVAEAVTGVISHMNLLHILTHFAVLPEPTVVVEIEPEREAWGEELSPAVDAALARAAELVRREIAA
ncbi:hypothetical protein BH18CHL2_BH18CHL2_08700 [soil metagenome]